MADYLILGLATWRISHLLVSEEGPWDFLSKFRHLAGVRYDEHSSPYSTNVFSELLTCIWCLSPWIGTILTLAYWRWSYPTILCSLPFALSAMAVIVNRWIDGKS